MIVFLNGKFVEKSRAKVSVFDRGFLYGDGVYDVLRTYNGKVFNVQAHVERLLISAKAIFLKVPWSVKQLSQWIAQTVQRNRFSEAVVRIILSRGEKGAKKPTIVIFAASLQPFSRMLYERGICAATFALDRPLAHIKSLNRLPNVLAYLQPQSRHCNEVFFVDSKGFVTEGARTNVYIVKNGKVFTPPKNVLAGTTRELLGKFVLIHQRKIPLRELSRADECFISSVIRGVMPVVKINGKKIGNGKPGPITQRLQKQFSEVTRWEAERSHREFSIKKI